MLVHSCLNASLLFVVIVALIQEVVPTAYKDYSLLDPDRDDYTLYSINAS